MKIQIINTISEAEKYLSQTDMSIEEIQDGVVEIVKYLCEPDPGHRGHPKVVGEKCKVSHYDLVRTIAHLDLLSKKAELALLK